MIDAILHTENFLPRADGFHKSQGIHLTLLPGSVVQVLGNEQDEVTLWLKGLAGLCEGYQGRLRLLGEDVAHLDRDAWKMMRTRVAYLGRQTRLLSVQTLMNNIILPAQYHKTDSQENLITRAQQMLDELGPLDTEVLELLPAYINECSYNTALLARALLLEPKLIILDDFLRFYNKTQARNVMGHVMNKVRQIGGVAIIHHHEAAVMPHANHILFVEGHNVLEFDNRASLLASNNKHVKAYLQNHDLT